MKVESSREGLIDPIWSAKLEDVIAYLNGDAKKEAVDQLYDFGKLLLDQIRELRDSFDVKLTSCLGWSSALLAVVLVGAKEWFGARQTLAGYTATAGSVAALISLGTAIYGLKSTSGWKWPSEKDWFETDYLAWPEKLKAHHLLAMLEAHQSYNARTQKKGHALAVAEWSLAGSGVLLGCAALIRQLGGG